MSYIDTEDNFFGRVEVLETLKRRVIGLKEGYRQNVALLGNQFSGKSSVLRNFLTQNDHKDVVVLYLDLEDKDFSYFFHKLIGSLLYQYVDLKGDVVGEDLSLLIEAVRPSLPYTAGVIDKIRKDFDRARHADAFLGLLTLTEVFSNESGIFCVLVLDEFQCLEEFSLPNVFQEVGKKIMVQKKCLYVLASSYPSLGRKILSEKLSLLFGNFEVLDLDSFDYSESCEFISHLLEDYKIGTHLKNFLTDFTSGQPLYLKLICRELKNLCALHKQSEIYTPLLMQAIENTLFDRWGVISRHFELTVKNLCQGKGNRSVMFILMALSNGHCRIEEVVKDVKQTRHHVKQRINRLIDEGIIFKNGQVYYLKDRLFKYWIKFVFQKRLKGVSFIPDKQRKKFKDELKDCIERFQDQTRQDFPTRIVDLFNCFDNDAFDLNGRRYKLPVFRDISPWRFQDDNGTFVDVFKARTEESVWFVVLKKDHLGENEVNTVMNAAKSCGEKPERCLIISLMDLDENVRLRIMQERFWIWNESEVNALMNLFDKPFIIQ